MWRFITLLISTIITSGCAAWAADTQPEFEFMKNLKKSDSMSVRYFDPANERRTVLSVGDIDATYDIEVNIKCRATSCLSEMPTFAALFAGAMPVDMSCENPRYARIQISKSGMVIDSVYINYTGKCLLYSNRSFAVDQNIITFLASNSVRDWAFLLPKN